VRAWGLVLAVACVACATVTPLDRGISLARQGRDLAAKGAFDEAIRRSPDSAAAYTNRGIVRARLGDLDGAIEEYTKAVALGSVGGDVHYNRGLVRIAKGDYRGAIADFTTALSVNPRHAEALFARGSARWLAGDFNQSRVDWLGAIELEPDPERKMRMRAALTSTPPARVPAHLTASPPARPAPPAPDAVLPASSPTTMPVPTPQGPLDSRALAARALDRELKGDRPGAIADLRAALAVEPDPERRQGIENLLQLLGAR
jgi:tetratricopeptide (TPR) repeat protein